MTTVSYMGGMIDHDILLEIRRENLRAIAREIGQGGKGITKLAEVLGKSQGQISHLIGENPSKPIGEKLAREIELKANKPPGWLDKAHGMNERLLNAVLEELDSLPKGFQLSGDMKRRLTALLYILIAEHGVSRERIREIISLVKETRK